VRSRRFALGSLVDLRVERYCFRHASHHLAIVIVVTRSAAVWVIATHRFFEVSLGIGVGLILSFSGRKQSPPNHGCTSDPRRASEPRR